MPLDKVKLKTLALELAAAMPPIPPPEADGQSTSGLPVVVQSARARAIRRISEIAGGRGWQVAVTRTLDEHRASYVDDLPDLAVFALCDRMEYFEDCVQCACDPDESPPAR